jgi:hypothetical protein
VVRGEMRGVTDGSMVEKTGFIRKFVDLSSRMTERSCF